METKNPVWLQQWLAETASESMERLSSEENQAMLEKQSESSTSYVEDLLDSLLLCSFLIGTASMVLFRAGAAVQ